MTDEQPPAWALNEAIKRLNAECGGEVVWRVEYRTHHVVIAFARTIARHEQPPVDPIEALYVAVIEQAGMDTSGFRECQFSVCDKAAIQILRTYIEGLGK
jgi:hypothetical protein